MTVRCGETFGEVTSHREQLRAALLKLRLLWSVRPASRTQLP